nr:retron St85 family effector protein [Chthonobacter albigriseus]
MRLIDFENSKIVLPRKLVFLCGGKASRIAGSPSSLRELLLQKSSETGSEGRIGEAEVLLAEDAVSALAKSAFKNLLDLEEFIAAIVQSVILIVESPGSMCELGAFVKTREIREKLIVVLQGEFKNVQSFITVGAVAYLEEQYAPSQILAFHWNTSREQVVSAPDYMLSEMLLAIPDAMAQVQADHQLEAFRSDRIGHLIYLTLSFCHVLRAAKLADLKLCFSDAGFGIEEITIRRCLDTLIICKLVKAVEHGRLTYYVSLADRMPLEIAFKNGTPNRDRDTLRWVTRIAESIENNEKHRTEMFRDHRR